MLTDHDYAAAAMLTTFLCGLGFALLVLVVVSRPARRRRARRTALVLLLVYPYAWFLYGSGYGDAFFLVVTVGAFVLLERDRPVLAGAAGFIATAARPTGTAVLIGLIAVALERRGVITRDLEPDTTATGWWPRERARWHTHFDRLRAATRVCCWQQAVWRASS